MHRRLAGGAGQAGVSVLRRGRSRPSRRSTRRVKRRVSSFSVSRTSAAGVRSTSIASSARSSGSTRWAAASSCARVSGGSAIAPRATRRIASKSSAGGAELAGRQRGQCAEALGHHAQRLEELVGRGLLVDDAVGARHAQRDFQRRIARLGVGDHARAAVGGDAAAELQTIADAEVRLEQNDVRRGARDEFERLLRRAGGTDRHEAGLGAQQRHEPGANGRLGVDDGDAGHARHPPSQSSRLT